MSVTSPTARIPAGRLQCVMIASGMAVANTRPRPRAATTYSATIAWSSGRTRYGTSQKTGPLVERAGARGSIVGNAWGQTVNDDPQPQPPVAFGFSNAKPDSWNVLL